MCLKNGLCFYNKEKLEIVHEKKFFCSHFSIVGIKRRMRSGKQNLYFL
ncbi:hypothetical protein BFO_0789 [Tannerella forsythia 92A2]|uniref:Uncharacterized protein n=1 Tax=Tannerella forsythia (strain ATCC 43037 / JCM 10827 / CCUG 21028 A / KCTC 5666 / FDC 338) TaxID=203275 RepID=G8UNH6_TANFA|nr:hypothetical protein BFO_0789 [Tannerella forsythia 92A2]